MQHPPDKGVRVLERAHGRPARFAEPLLGNPVSPLPDVRVTLSALRLILAFHRPILVVLADSVIMVHWGDRVQGQGPGVCAGLSGLMKR